MKKVMIFTACCLLAFSGAYRVRGEGENGREVRIVSPAGNVSLIIRDVQSGEERILEVKEDTVLFVPEGHSFEIRLREQLPGWIAAAEMPWTIGREEEAFIVPLHPFTCVHELHGDAEETGEFQFALFDEAGNRLAEWKNSPGQKAVLEGLKPVPGSELTVRTVSAPPHCLRNETVIRVPSVLKEDTWSFMSEAVPFAEKTVCLIPAEEQMHLQFFAEDESKEPCSDAEGNPAEYETDEEGKFTAVLGRGRYYVSCRETAKGYYPLQKKEFFFDTEEDELQIVMEPIRIQVRIQSDEDIHPFPAEIALYQGEEEIGRTMAENGMEIPGGWLKAGTDYRAELYLPEGYVCENSILAFSSAMEAPEEDPVLKFDVQAEVLPPPEPVLPEPAVGEILPETEVPPESDTEEEKKEEKKEEKAEQPEVKIMPLYSARPEMAVNDPPPAEVKPESAGFRVILKNMEGKAISGAVIRVENEAGETIAQWVSDEQPHRVEDGVVPGETYIISQQTAAGGYERMQMKIRFTMPADGGGEPLVTLQNQALEKAALRDEPLQLPRTGLYISMALAGLSLLAAGWILAVRQQKEEK